MNSGVQSLFPPEKFSSHLEINQEKKESADYKYENYQNKIFRQKPPSRSYRSEASSAHSSPDLRYHLQVALEFQSGNASLASIS